MLRKDLAGSCHRASSGLPFYPDSVGVNRANFTNHNILEKNLGFLKNQQV